MVVALVARIVAIGRGRDRLEIPKKSRRGGNFGDQRSQLLGQGINLMQKRGKWRNELGFASLKEMMKMNVHVLIYPCLILFFFLMKMLIKGLILHNHEFIAKWNEYLG